MTSSQSPMTGDQFREFLFGAEAVAAHKDGASGKLAPELGEVTDIALFGGVWQFPGLELRYRSLVTIVALATLGREREMAAHVRAGLGAGLTRDEIVQAMLQLAFYAGLPVTHGGLRVLQAVFDEMDEA
jgi:4-carboxymuconolactone decarboxylase